MASLRKGKRGRKRMSQCHVLSAMENRVDNAAPVRLRSGALRLLMEEQKTLMREVDSGSGLFDPNALYEQKDADARTKARKYKLSEKYVGHYMKSHSTRSSKLYAVAKKFLAGSDDDRRWLHRLIRAAEITEKNCDGLPELIGHRGAFATVDINKGQIVGIYSGILLENSEPINVSKDFAAELMSNRSIDHQINAHDLDAYIFCVKLMTSERLLLVSALNRGNITCLMNASDHGAHQDRRENCKIVIVRIGCGVPIILIEATRFIPKGQQVYLPYGEDYWGNINQKYNETHVAASMTQLRPLDFLVIEQNCTSSTANLVLPPKAISQSATALFSGNFFYGAFIQAELRNLGVEHWFYTLGNHVRIKLDARALLDVKQTEWTRKFGRILPIAYFGANGYGVEGELKVLLHFEFCPEEYPKSVLSDDWLERDSDDESEPDFEPVHYSCCGKRPRSKRLKLSSSDHIELSPPKRFKRSDSPPSDRMLSYLDILHDQQPWLFNFSAMEKIRWFVAKNNHVGIEADDLDLMQIRMRRNSALLLENIQPFTGDGTMEDYEPPNLLDNKSMDLFRKRIISLMWNAARVDKSKQKEEKWHHWGNGKLKRDCAARSEKFCLGIGGLFNI